jgi:GH24 family phage-related lysozyme (muramidase)
MRWITVLFSAALLGLGSAPAGAEEAASSADDWWEGTVTYTLIAPGDPDESQHGTETQEYTFTVAGRIGVASASLKVSDAWRDYICHVEGKDVWNSEEVDLAGDVVGSFFVTASGTGEYTLSVPTVGVRGSRDYVKVVSGCKTEPGTKAAQTAIGPQADLLRGAGNAVTDDELSGSVESDACWPYAWLSSSLVSLGACKRTVTWQLKRTKRDCNKDRRTSEQKKMKGSESIRKFIEKTEKLVPYMYNDDDEKWQKQTPSPRSNCTIGYGHKLHDGPCKFDGTQASEKPYYTKNQTGAIELEWLSDADADALFAKDLERFENQLNKDLKVPLTQNQFDALLDFVFNAGSLPAANKKCKSTGNARCQDILFQINCGVFDDVFGKRGATPVGLSRFINPGTQFEKGLRERRAVEERLWDSSDASPLHVEVGPAQASQETPSPPRPKPLPNVGPSKARISLTPRIVRGGKIVTVRGKNFGLRPNGCEPTVRLIAFLPAVSPYRVINLGRVDVLEGRAFKKTWRTKKFAFRFRWAVVALQKCKGKTLQRRDTVTIR